MNIRRYLFTICLLAMNVFFAIAQKNTLTTPDVTVFPGKQMMLPVNLDNNADIVAVEFSIQVPDGITLSTSGYQLPDRASGHSVKISNPDTGKYKIMVYSAKNQYFSARTGAILQIPISADESLPEGSEYAMTLSDVVIADKSGNDITTGQSAGKVIIGKSVDFEVSDVTMNPATVNPGGQLTVGWTVKNNGGVASTSGWKEQIYLKSCDGSSKLIGTTYYTGSLNSDGTISRTTTVTLPSIIGVDGIQYARVNLTPNSDSGEPVGARANNEAISASTVTIGKTISLSPTMVNTEESDNKNLQFKLTRSGSTTEDETFTVSGITDSRLTIPATVTIPAGQSSVYFYAKVTANKALDAEGDDVMTVSGTGYDDVKATISIDDDTYPNLTITPAKTDYTEGENIVFTVRSERAVSSDLALKMTSEQETRFTIPTDIKIPAGQSSVQVIVPIVDDDTPYNTESIEFKVVGEKHNPASTLIMLTDNDMPNLEMTLAPTTVSEGDGPLSVSVNLKRTTNTDKKITVKFSDDSNGGIYYGGHQTITLDKGVEQINMNIGAVDNNIVDGQRTYNITAAVYLSSCSCSASTGTSGGSVTVPLTVTDNDGPTLSLQSSKSVLVEGGEMTVTVTRNTTTTDALTVQLSSDHSSDVEMPSTVTIPAGATSADFTVKSANNQITGDGFNASVTATAEGFTQGTMWFTVSDQTLPDAQITAFTLSDNNPAVGTLITATATLTNTGNYKLAELTPVTFYLSSSSTAAGTKYLQNDLQPGESVELSCKITMPETIGSASCYAIANENKKVSELSYTNNTSKMLSVATTSPFTATVSTDKTVYQQGEKIVISGQLSGSVIANQSVEVYAINSGYRHSITATTDADGKFSADYTPYDGQMGHFAIGADFKGENQTAEMCGFDVYGMKLTSSISNQNISFGDSYNGVLTIQNPSSLSLSGIKVDVLSKPEDCNITFNNANTISANGSIDLAYTLTPTALSTGDQYLPIKLKISSTEGAELSPTIYYYCLAKKGKLKASVASIKTTMVKGQEHDYSFDISNIGQGETGEISLALPSWIKSVTPLQMASLDANGSTSVILRFTPTSDMQLNVPVTGTIGINCKNGDGLSMPFSVEPVSESTGTLTIDVCDEATYYTAEAPHVEGATVTINHPTTGAEITSGVTGKDGKFSLVLPEGYYSVSISADKHESYKNNILVDPGTETMKVINISYNPITVDWKVEETEVEDEYKVVTDVTFETNVPEPVVVTNMPESIAAKDLKDGESLVFAVTMTNKGLITAKDAQLILPDDLSTMTFESLASTATFDIAPQQSIVIPVKVTRHLTSTAEAKGGSTRSILAIAPIDNDPCVDQVGTLYYWDCGEDHKWHRYSIALQLGSCNSNDSTTWNSGDGSGGGSSIGWNIVGTGGGGNYLGGSGGSSYGSSTNDNSVKTQSEDEGCEPCQNRELMKWVECGLSFIPVYGCVKGSADCAREAANGETGWRHNVNCAMTGIGCSMDLCAGASLSTVVGAPAAAVCEIVGFITNVISCLVPFTEPCDREASSAKAKGVNSLQSNEPSYLTEFRSKAEIPLKEINAWKSVLTEIFGDDVWVSNTTTGELYDLLAELSFSEETTLTAEKYLSYKPARISTEEFEKFISRLNNTDIVDNGGSVNDNNYINKQKIRSYYEIIEQCESESYALGYKSTDEMWITEGEKCKEKLNQSQSSVCSSITLEFSQSMVMTRQAFRGTLTVYNGNTETAMTNVKLNLKVYDANGIEATSHEMQINPESIDGFTGELNLTSGWSLDAEGTGVAKILFIPTKYAAPTTEKVYYFGGSLTYVDPFTGLETTRDLTPVALTVKPSPNLDLTYFMQRDIKGDDPLTEVVEPSEEAEFSLLINNIGYGDATNVRMTTEQPEIVENEKGLKIDFELLSSQLNGGDKTLALGGSVATDFGTIAAQSTSYAQWWLKSSLLGHFTSYNVNATHVTSYDNPDLTLLNDVTIHELIRSLDVTNGSTTLKGFMTNDITDTDDTPDMLYLSNGEVESVNKAVSANITKVSATEYNLTVTPATGGWNYGNLLDPTYGISELKSVTRQSDGKSISLRNFWQTDRTLRDGKDPLYENRLHFADDFSSSAAETYILTFDPVPDLRLEVASIDGVPVEGTVAVEAVKTLSVQFNKQIDPTTFTDDDITISVQGVKQDSEMIHISTSDNKTFQLDLSDLYPTVGNGYYTIQVATASITDTEGYRGKDGKSAGWIYYKDGLLSLVKTVYPENSGIIQYQEKDASATAENSQPKYGRTYTFTATPNTGYTFSNWTVNGEVVSTDPEIEYVALSDMNVVANFTANTYALDINSETEGGTITGTSTGIYGYGTSLSLTAVPDEDYVFDYWMVNGEKNTNDATLTFTLDKQYTVTAVFKREYYNQKIIFSKGWNWVSSYLTEPISTSEFSSNVERIVGQFDEVIRDPVYGLIGGLETMDKNYGYKINASRAFIKDLRGHLNSDPLDLEKGWNWMAYPYYETKSLSTTVTNAEDGDYIIDQEGFSAYGDGYWEGTLTELTPGVGYLYKSASKKTLQMQFENTSSPAKVSAKTAAQSTSNANIELGTLSRDYPNTMNVIAQLYQNDYAVYNDNYVVYAMTGDTFRGFGQRVGGNYYITIYGDESVPVSFVIQDTATGTSYLANETLPFVSDIIGSRQSPYKISLGSATDIKVVWADNCHFTIYSVEGILINADGNYETFKHLPSGVYIVNGRKYIVK